MSSVLIRKALAFLLALTMLLGLMPGAVAEEFEEIVYEESLPEELTYDVLLPEELTFEESASEGSISEQTYEEYGFADDGWELSSEEAQETGNNPYVSVR